MYLRGKKKVGAGLQFVHTIAHKNGIASTSASGTPPLTKGLGWGSLGTRLQNSVIQYSVSTGRETVYILKCFSSVMLTFNTLVVANGAS